MIKVLNPGLYTTIQDAGRIGYYEIGLPPSGALDKYSYRLSNLLVGNEPDDAVLEITYMGPELEFLSDALIAITGGEIPPKINGKTFSMYETISVNAGDILSFDYLKSGARVYLSVSGGFDVPKVMGSRSTYTRSAIGGVEGRTLKANDILHFGDSKREHVKEGTKLPATFIPAFSDYYELRMVEGLYSHRIKQESIDLFYKTVWTVTPEANRVGYRLQGERLEFIDRKQPYGAGSNLSNVVDTGYPIGSIQIPDGVEPIILLDDAVTSGGYATIGTVISSDLNILAQAKTHDKIKFISVTMEEALLARNDFKAKIKQIEEIIHHYE